MLTYRRRVLSCIVFFVTLFFIILLQEFIVLDKFEYSIAVNESNQKSNEKCLENEAIDLVYTWVNGSDPSFRRIIQLYQQLEQSQSDQCSDLVATPFLLVIPQVIPSTYEKLIANISNQQTHDLKQWYPVKYKIEKDLSSSLFYFEDIRKAKEYLISKPRELYNYKLHQLYLPKSNCNQTDEQFKSIKLENTFKIDRRFIQDDKVKLKLIQDFEKFLKIDKSKNLISYEFVYENYEISAIDSKYNVDGLEILANEYSKYEIDFTDQEFKFKLISNDLKLSRNDDAYGENRFSDKDELKYSLRSVEKYANWIRNIYIVTNGQVPEWLNISNSQIKIVNHKDIYTNQSHLPTFNSASIECHIHRIRGLSRRFLYMNDDFMFGQPVYLEDFYSRSKGYNIRLGWSAPKCASNCPTGWLQDGICDKSCNTSMCLYDGGDCLKEVRNQKQITNLSVSNKECKAECLTDWLADEHCDQRCNNLDCGFDMGDCKVDKWQLNLAYHLENYNQNQTIYVFNQTSSTKKCIYLNMTNYLKGHGINDKAINDVELNSTNQTFIHILKFNHKISAILILLNDSIENNLPIEFNLTFRLNSESTIQCITIKINPINLTTMSGSDDQELLHPKSTGRRQLMDFYADSLVYSNYIFTKKYRIENRKVPAHMPILLDRHILERMNVELFDEIQETSAHRFRNSRDLQFAFAYYYFLMSEQKYPTLREIAVEFDRDMDERLSRKEARTMYLATTKNQFEEKDFELFWNQIRSDCQVIAVGGEDRVSIDTLINCNDFVFLSDEVKVRKRNKFIISKMNDVSFNQIGNDVSTLPTMLDKVLKSPTQFICINDNFFNSDVSQIELVNRILHDFYESMLPLKSKFESTQTPVLTTYRSKKSSHTLMTRLQKSFLLLVIVCAFCIIFLKFFCLSKRENRFSIINTI